MSEPSAIWSTCGVVFDKTIGTTQNVILSHARFSLQALIRRVDRLHALIKESPLITDTYVHPDIPAMITDLCNQQGIASTILFDDTGKKYKESQRSFQLRKERVAYVRHWSKGVPIQILSSRKLRNSLIHFDEHVADAMTRPKTGWLVDTAINRRDQFTAAHHGIDVAFCRVYIASEDRILHLDHEIPASKLKWEAKAILAAVYGEPHPGLLSRPLPTPPNREPMSKAVSSPGC